MINIIVLSLGCICYMFIVRVYASGFCIFLFNVKHTEFLGSEMCSINKVALLRLFYFIPG